MDERAVLVGPSWRSLNHWSVRARFELAGWSLCGQGDWAYAYRSPRGRLVARISPFERGYEHFVDLCERCAGNRYLPRIELATQLEGGGYLAVLEHLSSPTGDLVEQFLQRWEQPPADDDDLRALRREVDRIDAWGRAHVRWWVGVDIGDRHVLLSADGNPKIIDLFGAGTRLLDDLVDDPHAFARHIPAEHRRYLLDMPDLQADDHPADYLQRIRAAIAEAERWEMHGTTR